MVVVMQERATEVQIDAVISRLIELGMDVHRSSGATRTVLGVVGANKIDPGLIGILDGVHEVLRISEPYKLASRTFRPHDTVARREMRVYEAHPFNAEALKQSIKRLNQLGYFKALEGKPDEISVTPTPGKEGLADMKVIAKLYASAASGKTEPL